MRTALCLAAAVQLLMLTGSAGFTSNRNDEIVRVSQNVAPSPVATPSAIALRFHPQMGRTTHAPLADWLGHQVSRRAASLQPLDSLFRRQQHRWVSIRIFDELVVPATIEDRNTGRNVLPGGVSTVNCRRVHARDHAVPTLVA